MLEGMLIDIRELHFGGNDAFFLFEVTIEVKAWLCSEGCMGLASDMKVESTCIFLGIALFMDVDIIFTNERHDIKIIEEGKSLTEFKTWG